MSQEQEETFVEKMKRHRVFVCNAIEDAQRETEMFASLA
jgi:hypothetical protein